MAGHKRTSDYINANFINGFEQYHAYIGTQGPLEETCEAFWRMIWEQSVFVIVMITNLTERGRVKTIINLRFSLTVQNNGAGFFQRKCDMYWPKELDSSATYGFIEVFLEKEEIMANYTVRSMRIKHLKVS